MDQASALLESVALAARQGAARGWMPATSGNVSARVGHTFFVSRSGIDKASIGAADFIELDLTPGQLAPPKGAAAQPSAARATKDQPLAVKPSAEAALHGAIYRACPEATCVLHFHTLAATLVSLSALEVAHEAGAKASGVARGLRLTGLELIKALGNARSHEDEVIIPLFANDQDMDRLAEAAERRLGELPAGATCVGLLLRGHGLYVWGAGAAAAFRHAEAFDFLFQCVTQRPELATPWV